jgi:hypothetical protein
LHSTEPDIRGLDEIPDDSDGEYDVEELLFAEECTELQEELISDELNTPSPLASISLFSPSTSSSLAIHMLFDWD